MALSKINAAPEDIRLYQVHLLQCTSNVSTEAILFMSETNFGENVRG